MNELGILFTIACCGLVIAAPRRNVCLALIIAALWIPRSQELVIGPFHFTVLRVVILAGISRALFRGERVAGNWNFLDRLMGAWAFWAICSSTFHSEGFSIARLGEVYTAVGLYYMFRVYLRDTTDLRRIFQCVCIVLIPIAILMVMEKSTGTNTYAALFGDSSEVANRIGHFRAKGPFAHPITAGTVGALSLTIALYLSKHSPRIAFVGLLASTAVVLASGASGPIMTAVSILFAMALWKAQRHVVTVRRASLVLLLLMQIVMNDPVYYIIARIDITGGSTSYYRAALIESAIDHLNEWWLVGTDFTNHWASTQMGDKTDITNHYIQMGVWGGIPLLFLFIAVLWAAFSCIGRIMLATRTESGSERFLTWTLGSMLFGHVVTFFSISYFDQANVLFIYLILAAVATRYSSLIMRPPLMLRSDIPSDTLNAVQMFGGFH